MKKFIKSFISVMTAMSIIVSVNVQAAPDKIVPENHAVYMQSIATGEITAIPAELADLDFQHNRGVFGTNKLATAVAKISDGSIFTRASDWTAYAEANWMNDGETSWVWSYASRMISFMGAQNVSYYSNGVQAGNDMQLSPSGSIVGAISAYVTARPGFTLSQVYGYHSFRETGYDYINLSTHNTR